MTLLYGIPTFNTEKTKSFKTSKDKGLGWKELYANFWWGSFDASERQLLMVQLTLHYIGCHESSCVVIALEVTSCQVTLQLEAEQVPRVLLLQLTRVGDVELDHEPQHGFTWRQPYLLIHGFISIKPVLKKTMLF